MLASIQHQFTSTVPMCWQTGIQCKLATQQIADKQASNGSQHSSAGQHCNQSRQKHPIALAIQLTSQHQLASQHYLAIKELISKKPLDASQQPSTVLTSQHPIIAILVLASTAIRTNTSIPLHWIANQPATTNQHQRIIIKLAFNASQQPSTVLTSQHTMGVSILLLSIVAVRTDTSIQSHWLINQPASASQHQTIVFQKSVRTERRSER